MKQQKVWMPIEFKRGYVSEFDVYTSKKGDKIKKELSAFAAINLTNKLRNKTDHVIFNNFYITKNLLLDLQL